MAKINMTDKAYKIIRRQISDFDLYPGQTVSDYLLSKEFDMSRTPIRQALQKLENDGLLEKTDSGSATYRVAPITAEEIKDLFDFREGIEATAFKLSWQVGITEEQVQALQRVVDDMVSTNNLGQVKEHFIHDQQFHNSLVVLSRNKRLIKAHDELLLQFTRMRFLSFLDRSLQDKACSDHNDILDSIRKGDYEHGMTLIINHISTSREHYIGLLNDGLPSNLIHMLRFFSKSGNE